jgi:cytochrome c oxidase subunit II
MSESIRRLLILGILLLVGIILLAGTYFIYGWFFSSRPIMSWGTGRRGRLPFQSFGSNGERIYFTGTSETGPPITSQMQEMHRMSAGRMACVDCHGPDGTGGTVRMMMSSFEAPDIRYHTLTEEEHDGDHADHPPYTDEDIKRAVTEGIDPGGQSLEWLMPRWDMTDEQLDDLLEFLKSLD